jgi:ADP-heptose:LPS heptosyltransferase
MMVERHTVGFRTEPFCGDTFVTTAFAAGIRRKFPNATIVARTENELQADIFFRNPSIDETSASIARTDAAVWFDFYRVPTVWYDEAEFPREERVARARREEINRMLLGAPVHSEEARRGGMWMLGCMLDLLRLGRVQLTCILTDIQATINDASIYLSEQDHSWAEQVCAARNVVTLYNGTGTKTWSWLVHRWSQVAEYLRSRGFAVYQLGVASDLPVPGADSLLGATTLRQAAALVRRACLHVGTDGAMTHFAAAYGIPTVALFGPNPAGAYGYDTQLQVVAEPCKNCWDIVADFATTCLRNRDNECMKSITVERVCRAIDRVIARSPAHNRR